MTNSSLWTDCLSQPPNSHDETFEIPFTMEKLAEARRKLEAETGGVGAMPFRIHTDPYLIDLVQVRFPRSKRKRIQKKWRKDDRNYANVPSKSIMRIPPNGEHLVMHPEMYNKLLKATQKQQEASISKMLFSI